jgi:hypothetical protein
MEYGEIVKIVDGFYADAANARVPILYALMWAKNKVSGATAEELDAQAAKMRANYAAKEPDR